MGGGLGGHFAEALQGFGQLLADGFVGDAGHFSDGCERVGFMALESEAQLEEVLFPGGELFQVITDVRIVRIGCVWGGSHGDGFDRERGTLVFDGVLECGVAGVAG